MLLFKVTFSLFVIHCVKCEENKIRYDSFTGSPISEPEYKERVKKNTTFWCVNDIKPCDPYEGRRVDGSCNHLRRPTRGAVHTPFYRLLPPVYDKVDNVYEPRKAKDGGSLPLPRHLRTSLMSEGTVPNQEFTQLVTHFLVFFAGDFVSVQDTVNYVRWRPYCCQPKGKTDRACTPIKVPDNDPVHRFSDIRCLNLTRPESFQSVGCINQDTPPERVSSATPAFDLSALYGSDVDSLNKRRIFEKGMLKYETEDGRIWPPSTKTKIDLCLANQKPKETRCHDTPESGTNTILGSNLMSIWLWRHHNFIALSLAKENPCWSDQKVFDTARDINIAMYNQIMYYELFPILMGKNNLLRDGVISSSLGHRDIYNDQMHPEVSLEFPFALRWFHTMQEGALKLYDYEGYYLKQDAVVNITLRTGYLAVDDNIDYVTQGSFRQPCAKADYVVDADISEIGLGWAQRAADLLSSDMSKNRLFGFQPYIKYKEFCDGRPYSSFEDLKKSFYPERLEVLRNNYRNIHDMDMLAGIWLEKHVEGGYIPQLLYCIVTEQLVKNIVSDRHWYERELRPNAFTAAQLYEIRKSTISMLLCNVGDKVTKIQPYGFIRTGKGNEICSCEQIPKLDFSAWKDRTCFKPEPVAGYYYQ